MQGDFCDSYHIVRSTKKAEHEGSAPSHPQWHSHTLTLFTGAPLCIKTRRSLGPGSGTSRLWMRELCKKVVNPSLNCLRQEEGSKLISYTLHRGEMPTCKSSTAVLRPLYISVILTISDKLLAALRTGKQISIWQSFCQVINLYLRLVIGKGTELWIASRVERCKIHLLLQGNKLLIWVNSLKMTHSLLLCIVKPSVGPETQTFAYKTPAAVINTWEAQAEACL